MKTVYKVLEYGWNDVVDLGVYEVTSREEAKQMALEKHYPDLEEKLHEGAKYGMTTEYVSGYKDETKVVRCVTCAGEFSEIEIEGATCCPGCSSKGVPMSIAEDVTVKINWHELRILSIWAENWAKKIQKDDPEANSGCLLTIMSIAGRLQNQHPDKTKLTLFSEIRDLRKDYTVETNIDSDEQLGLD
jgi:hypothetical protein